MRHGADLVPLPAGLRGSAKHIVARCLTRDVDLFAIVALLVANAAGAENKTSGISAA